NRCDGCMSASSEYWHLKANPSTPGCEFLQEARLTGSWGSTGPASRGDVTIVYKHNTSPRCNSMTTARETYAMLDNRALWEAASRSHALLNQHSLPHAVVGGVAVCLHGYQRNTVDVDLLVRSEDADALRQV